MTIERNTAHPGIMQFGGIGTRAVFTLFVLVYTCLTIYSIEAVAAPIGAILALMGICLAAALLSARGPMRFPLDRTLAVFVLCTASSLSVWNLPDTGWPGWATWIWGAVTFCSFMLTLRGRTAWGWVTFCAMAAMTVLWCVVVGRGVFEGVGFVIRSAALLFVVSLFRVLLKRTAAAIVRVQATERERLSRGAALTASAEEESDRMDRLRSLAFSPLELIAKSTSLNSDDRSVIARAELTLRDHLRAGRLLSPGVAEAVDSARGRRVTVLLFDDGAPEDADDFADVGALLMETLRDMSSGRCVVRILPPGREGRATLLAEGATGAVRLLIR